MNDLERKFCAMPVDFKVLEEVLKAEDWVSAAWLFVSSSNGIVRPGSDVDIAVLTVRKPSLDEHLELQANLAEATAEEVDLVVINDASSILRFEALQGRSLYCQDLSQRAVFASWTAREYEDDMALAERGLKAWREAQASSGTPGE